MNIPEMTYTRGINIAHFVLKVKTLQAHIPATRKTPPKMTKVQYSVNRQISFVRRCPGVDGYQLRNINIVRCSEQGQRASRGTAMEGFYSPAAESTR